VFKHANFAGTWAKGGVLAVAGDDHNCKSSTLPSQSEFAFADFEMPVLSPPTCRRCSTTAGGIALSRFSGLWTGLIALADTMDSGVTIDVGLGPPRLPRPAVRLAGGRPGHPHQGHSAGEGAPAAAVQAAGRLAWARANGIDRVVLPANRPRLGIVCQGQAYKDVIEAFAAMGIGFPEAAALGISIYKVGMPWPLEPQGLRAFAAGLETLMVIEHKRGLIEPQARAALYDLPRTPGRASSARPTRRARRCWPIRARCR
jgi:indolepyruvate ferredoxin oxidoreductase